MEEQSLEGITQENRSIQPFGASESRSPTSLFRDDQEASGNKYHQTDSGEGCEAFESSVYYQKERRWLEANRGLPKTQQCNQDNILQARRPQNSGENHTRKGLRGHVGLEPSLLSYKNQLRIISIPFVRFQRKILRFPRNAFLIQRCSSNVHKSNEKSPKIHEGGMEGENNCIPGRYCSSSSRPAGTQYFSGENHFYVQQIGTIGQFRKMSFNSKSAVQIFGLPMGYQSVCGTDRGIEENRTDERVQEMEEDCPVQQSCFDKEVCLVDGETERNKIRVSRSLPEFVTTVQTPKQSFESEWMERKNARECIDNKLPQEVERKAEREPTKEIESSVSTRSNSYDRCIRVCHRCNTKGQQSNAGLSQTSSTSNQKPKFKLQRAIRNKSSHRAFLKFRSKSRNRKSAYSIRQHNSSLQSESMGSGSESQNPSEENMESNPSAESGCESSTYSRREKRQSRLPIEIGKRRRLRNRTRSTRRDFQSASDAHHTRCLRNKRKHKINEMVRAGKQSESRRVTNFMERRDGSCTSTSSLDSSSYPKSSDGESSSFSSSFRLEGSDMGTSAEQHTSHLLDMEENGGDNQGRKIDEAYECNASSRETEDMRNQSITEKGESWWNEILASRSMSRELAEECKNSVASATWMGYTYGFTHFKDGWDQLKFKDIPSKFQIWQKRCLDVFVALKNSGMKASSLRIVRSVISFLTSVLYRKSLGENTLISILFRSFRRSECRKKKRQDYMQNPQQLFTYIETIGKNENLSFSQLSKKTICLCMMFSACRFTELERINLKESEIDKQSIFLNSSLKTGLERSNIVIPFLSKESLICPATAVKDQWDRVKIHNPNSNKLFLSSSTYDPMKARAIRKAASQMMKYARIPSNNSPYTLKHTSISALTMA
ncbi:uncharacterized protein MONOS_13376 [Monocercomonoides exilis]|uniref:uncharacterized protein n=1 Tax=Monocercomonoides exilis TaxID=2049356 RepID=UPI003559913B|nr:hypothetical protein MONOS_13376 [Monocercomonoides exilis]|eukprot:MONOS_13376.1-p1 / transcript=MONOS_13376.1 / gene=MONOS_13376 / organism=Monocercomonoides_exilis_PA203 / gene_product=unspecified product / transcript_product=unspecified product / location=Mono_scaffold00818:21534-24200(-) / protein_length=888 / sequence_SO=supercontig / SO=protein_coding / is_pseudo=false